MKKKMIILRTNCAYLQVLIWGWGEGGLFGLGELQGLWVSVSLIQHLIDQLKQFITQLPHLAVFLGVKWLLVLRYKQNPASSVALQDQNWGQQQTLWLSRTQAMDHARPCSSPGPGLRIQDNLLILQDQAGGLYSQKVSKMFFQQCKGPFSLTRLVLPYSSR